MNDRVMAPVGFSWLDLSAIAVGLALGAGCAVFERAAKDPAAAVAEARTDSAKAERVLMTACTEFELAEAKGLVPAGPAKSDADAFCAAVRAASGE